MQEILFIHLFLINEYKEEWHLTFLNVPVHWSKQQYLNLIDIYLKKNIYIYIYIYAMQCNIYLNIFNQSIFVSGKSWKFLHEICIIYISFYINSLRHILIDWKYLNKCYIFNQTFECLKITQICDPGPQKCHHKCKFFEIEISTSSESWIHTLSNDVRTGQYLAEIQLYGIRGCYKFKYWENHH